MDQVKPAKDWRQISGRGGVALRVYDQSETNLGGTGVDFLFYQVHSYEIRYEVGAAGIGGAFWSGRVGELRMAEANQARVMK